jgi:uridine kinase
MAVFRESGLLANTLVEEIQGAKNFIVGIDGKDGSGKSRLAKELSEKLSAKVIELDHFMERNQGQYVSALRTKELLEAICQASGIIIVEGVCLLAALKRLSIKLDALVYVKRTHHGLWMDEDICLIEGSAEETINKQEEDLLLFSEWEAANEGKPPHTEGGAKLSSFTEEIIRYHAEYSPLQKAQHVYEAEHA